MPLSRLVSTFALLMLVLSFSIGLATAQDSATPSAEDAKARRIVEEADRIRFPAEGFQVDVAIVTTGKDKAPDERKYRVLSKGNENTVVMVTEPASERGQILLMKEHDLWVFLPNVSQPVRLSLAQREYGPCESQTYSNQDLCRSTGVEVEALEFADAVDQLRIAQV